MILDKSFFSVCSFHISESLMTINKIMNTIRNNLKYTEFLQKGPKISLASHQQIKNGCFSSIGYYMCRID